MISDAVLIAAIAAIPSTLGTLISLKKLGNLETKVNGRLTELLELNRKSSKAEGVKEEKERAG